jgi:D-3-phosphoglycerate dehydrogenase / 2-oxoglutarate reductase
MKRRVLISAPYMLPVVERFRARLEAEAVEIVTAKVRERLSEAELLPLVAEIDGVICGDDQFTEKVFRRAPRLKIISKWGTGIDSIDLRAARRAGVRVFNTPNAFTDPVADTALGYILCFARRLPWMDADVRRGRWRKPPAAALRECTLGIVGVGNIGRAVARRAAAFGINILGADPAPVPAAFVEETGIDLVPLPLLLAASDFISLHCDLNPTSFHLIGEAEFGLMRSSAFLINTSRGAVIDEAALVAALRAGEIAGAALDVFEVEPLPPDSPLLKMDNCLLAPHNSNSSPAAWESVHESTVANLLRGLRDAERAGDDSGD